MTLRFACLLMLLAWPGMATAQRQFDPFGEARIDEKPGARVPLDGRFVNARGASVTLRELANGRPVVLAPVLHNCPNICGVTLAGLADSILGQKKKPGRDFIVVAFGIDPKEGPKDAAGDLARLEDHAPKLGTQAIYALTGPASAIHAVTGALGYHYAYDPRIGQYAHASAVAILSPRGRLTNWLYGLTPQPAALSQAIDDAAKERRPSLAEQVLLVCFHYDPKTGQYTASIQKILRLAGIATVFAIALLIWRSKRKAA